MTHMLFPFFLSLLITYICNNIMISAYYDLAVLHYTLGVTRLTNMLLKEKITFLEDFFFSSKYHETVKM